MANWKTIRVSPKTHSELIKHAEHTGLSIDSLLQRYFLSRYVSPGRFLVGHCKWCKKPIAHTWEQLDETVDKVGYYHADCLEKKKKAQKMGEGG